MKKYNMHEIMANAWNIRRTNNVSMSTALRAAWALAKAINTAEEVRRPHRLEHQGPCK